MANQAEIPSTKGIGNIKWADIVKGVYYAAIGQFLALIGFLISGLLTEHPHFPTWAEWLPYVKATVYAIGGYVAGKLGVNNVGQIFQKDKGVVRIDVDTLHDLKQNQVD